MTTDPDVNANANANADVAADAGGCGSCEASSGGSCDASSGGGGCVCKVNFTGTWKLDRSDDLDDYLKSEGWGYIMRKVAKQASATQFITHTDTIIKLKIKNARGMFEYSLDTSSAAEVKYVDNESDEVVTVCVVTDDGAVVQETMCKGPPGKDKKKYITRRFMKDDEMHLSITNTIAKPKTVVRIFKKIADPK